METKSALIVGSTGLIGNYCLQFLLDEPSYKRVTALVRRPMDIAHAKLEQHVIEFDDLETMGSLFYVDDVYCCLGTTIKNAGSQEAFRRVDFTYPVKIAALTQHCGAKQFLIVTSLGADPHSRIFYSKVKGETEEAIRKMSIPALHIFRPSLLLGKRKEQRTAEKAGAILMSSLKYTMVGPLKKYRPIQASDVAKAMVYVALKEKTGLNIYEYGKIQNIAELAKRRKTP
jgi:uncharacterized protein YbjT (DUF2867 family)